MKPLPLVLLLALPLFAHAETWSSASSRDGDNWTVDTDSIQAVTVSGKTMKQAVVRAKYKEVTEDMGRKYDESRTTDVYDCTGKTSATREEQLLLAGTVVRKHATADDELEFIDIFPNTASADIAKVICGK
ncbi:MAG TPA: surface-adhesin E family protein [Fluviicoccus sp.]|nr:surface-adhesin E family protein [Fluviicoccus sp.]